LINTLLDAKIANHSDHRELPWTGRPASSFQNKGVWQNNDLMMPNWQSHCDQALIGFETDQLHASPIK
jgi:hypothetical protein